MASTITYNQMCNSVFRAMGEVEFNSSGTDFNNATGFHASVKDYVNWAIQRIYDEEDGKWPFLEATGTINLLVDGTVNYSVSTLADNVDWNSFAITYDAALDEPWFRKLTNLPWVSYRDSRLEKDKNIIAAAGVGTDGYSKPDVMSRKSDNTVSFSPPAKELYTATYDYFTAFTYLSAYNDVSLIPDRFNQVIIDGALKRVYDFRDNVEQAQVKDKDFTDGINRMRRKLIPQYEAISFVGY